MKPIETEEEYRSVLSDFSEACFVGMSNDTIRELAEALEAYEKIHYPIPEPTQEDWEEYHRDTRPHPMPGPWGFHPTPKEPKK